MNYPALVYDGDCGFCKRWIMVWQRHTRGLNYVAYQSLKKPHPTLTDADFNKALHLCQDSETSLTGADAVFESFRFMRMSWLATAYQKSGPLKQLFRSLYRWIANHRPLMTRLTKIFYGMPSKPVTHDRVRFLFFRGLGVIYLLAFASLIPQISGLLDPDGIASIGVFLDNKVFFTGGASYSQLPTFFWLNKSHAFIMAVARIGLVASVLMICRVWTRWSLLTAFLCYLSFMSVGEPFFPFQWDILLLEVSFFAFFMTFSHPVIRRVAHLGLIWTAFRLFWGSGVAKLLSNDPKWLDGSALSYHFWTQPLPHYGAWLMLQLPAWILKLGTWLVITLEVVGAWFMVFPRRIRFWIFWPSVMFQILIMLTGNFGFFNLLTIVLLLALLDDRQLPNWHWLDRFIAVDNPTKASRRLVPVAVLIMSLHMIVGFNLEVARLFNVVPTRFISTVYAKMLPFRVVNTYGLFAYVTEQRYELLIEGSEDRLIWMPLAFKYKPEELTRFGAFVQPHMPRLIWQLWFLGLNPVQLPHWSNKLISSVVSGRINQMDVLQYDTFIDSNPKFFRITFQSYRPNFDKSLRELGKKVYWIIEPIPGLQPLQLDFSRPPESPESP